MTVSAAFPASIVINPAQCRAARGLLGWTQVDLALKTGLSKTSIAQFETGVSESRNTTRRILIETFTRYGIEFMPPNGVNKLPVYCRVFNNDVALTHDWPLFLKSLANAGHTHLDVFNWPDFAHEFTKQTGVDPVIVSHDDQPYDRTAMIGQWMILPILQSPYRLALYQACDPSTVTSNEV
jgi:transcriptional regulator with XRE-family HTH domain